MKNQAQTDMKIFSPAISVAPLLRGTPVSSSPKSFFQQSCSPKINKVDSISLSSRVTQLQPLSPSLQHILLLLPRTACPYTHPPESTSTRISTHSLHLQPAPLKLFGNPGLRQQTEDTKPPDAAHTHAPRYIFPSLRISDIPSWNTFPL